MLTVTAAVRPPTATPLPAAPISGSRPSQHAARLANWRASAFSVFADDQGQSAFSLWPRAEPKPAAAKPVAPPAAQRKQPAAEAAATPENPQRLPNNMRFRSALEQVSYFTNDAAFRGRFE